MKERKGVKKRGGKGGGGSGFVPQERDGQAEQEPDVQETEEE